MRAIDRSAAFSSRRASASFRSMAIRDARVDDLPAIVEIYNMAIPGRMATADLTPISVDSRRSWFVEHTPGIRPLWVVDEAADIRGWLSFQSFYGRPAYSATAEVSVYVSPKHHRGGYGRALLAHAVDRAPSMGLKTLLGFIFGHNEPSLALFRRFGFETWAHLPRVAKLDGIECDVLILGLRLTD